MSTWDGHPEQDDGPVLDPEVEEQRVESVAAAMDVLFERFELRHREHRER